MANCKLYLVSGVTLLIASLPTALAAPPTINELWLQCDLTLQACDRAYQDEHNVSESQRELILAQKNQIAALSSPPPFYKSPVLWGIIGVGAGIFITKQVQK